MLFLLLAPLLAFGEESPGADSGDQLRKAEKVVELFNRANELLEKGYFGQSRELARNVYIYSRVWQLPRRAPSKAAKNDLRAVKAPKGVFTEKEEKALAASLDNMDKALEAALKSYRSLEEYILDDSIRDDGKRGRALAAAIESRLARFNKARRAWISLWEKKADSAEAFIWRGHPLRRQIIDAQRIRRILNQALNLTREGDGAAEALKEADASLREILADAEKPPFRGSPALERLYREFLKKVDACEKSLGQCAREGRLANKRLEIAIAVSRVGVAYNAFAKAVNEAR